MEEIKLGKLIEREIETESDEKLREMLVGVSDSYDDFVLAIMRSCKKNGAVQKMISAVSAHPEWNTSDIIIFDTEEILKIKPAVRKAKGA